MHQVGSLKRTPESYMIISSGLVLAIQWMNLLKKVKKMNLFEWFAIFSILYLRPVSSDVSYHIYRKRVLYFFSLPTEKKKSTANAASRMMH